MPCCILYICVAARRRDCLTSSDICEVSLSLRPKIRAQTCLPFAGQRYASSALPRYASRPTEVPCYNWLRRDAPRGCKYRKQLECLQGERVQIRGGTISFHTQERGSMGYSGIRQDVSSARVGSVKTLCRPGRKDLSTVCLVSFV